MCYGKKKTGDLRGDDSHRQDTMLSVVCATSGLVLPSAVAPAPVSRAAARMACIEEFSISREIKSVRIFDGAYVCTRLPCT